MTADSRRHALRGLQVAVGMALVALGAQGCSDTNAEQTSKVRTALLPFSRSHTPREVPYVVHGEWAITEGDILLGKVEQVEAESAALRAAVQRNAVSSGRVSSQGIGIKSTYNNGAWKWPDARIPYVIDTTNMNSGSVAGIIQSIQLAAEHWSRRTRIQLVPRSNEPDYIRFRVDTSLVGSCNSAFGRQGGEQYINFPPTGCGFGTFVHEIGHAVGLFHEHTRPDRNNFVTIHPEAIDTATYGNVAHNFLLASEVPSNPEADVYTTPYDFRSIMHYPERAFAKAGMRTIIPVNPLPPGVTLGQQTGLSDGDLDTVGHMYISNVEFKYLSIPIPPWQPHPLGNPVGPEVSIYTTSDDLGRMRNYQNGSIYWHWDTGAFSIRPEFFSKWQAVNTIWGPLGYPVSDEIQYSNPSYRSQYFKGGRIDIYPSGFTTNTYSSEIAIKYAANQALGASLQPEGPSKNEGRFQRFANGSIYWHPRTGAFIVKPQIESKWAELGRESSILGFPTSDTLSTPDGGMMNHFQGGDISWSSAHGYVVMVNDLQNSQYEYYSGIKGHVEELSSAWGLKGWVYDHDSPGAQTEMHFYIDGPAGAGAGYGGGWTNLVRTDVNNAYQLPAGSQHGFQVPIPEQYYDGQPHTLYAYGLDNQGSGHNPWLDRNAYSFTFPGAEGHVESVTSDGRVVGWALDMNSKSVPIAVHFYIGGPYTSGTGYFSSTTVFRDDVNGTFGAQGNHGFSWTIPSQYIDGYYHSLYVYAIDAQGRHNPLLDGRSYSFRLGTPPEEPGCDTPCDCTGTCISRAMCDKICWQDY